MATLHIPEESVEQYSYEDPWSSFGKIVSLSIEEFITRKCGTPVISYNNGELQFSCSTNSAEFICEITDDDIKKHYDNNVKLSTTYHVSVVAVATGYENSDVATATLCWIEIEPKGEDITDKIVETKAYPVLIQSNGGVITVQGFADKAKVEVYSINGVEVGNGISSDGMAIINTRLNSGEIAVIKIGQKSVKVVLK